MDGLDAASVGEAVAAARPDAIVNQMTALSVAHAGKPNPRRPDRFFAATNRLRSEGIDHLLAAAEATGVSHVVAQGHASMNGVRKGGWVKTEEDPLEVWRGRRRSTTSRTRWSGPAARSCATAGSTGRAPTTIRSSSCASGCSRSSGVAPATSRGCTSTTRRALPSWRWSRGRTGVFNIVDDEPAPVSEWLPYLAECVGAKPPRRVPAWLARLLAGEMAVGMMTEGRGFSNAKAKRELGWELRYPSWRQGFEEELA